MASVSSSPDRSGPGGASPGLPQSSRTTVQVRFAETDLMGIVHHANYLVYFEAARVDFIHKRGVSYEEWLKAGVHLPVVEVALRYKKAARFDELLVVEATCVELTRVTVKFDYRILRADDLLVTGSTLLACVGDNLAPRRIPDAIASVFKSPEVAR
jgi:acyl-CoA thioester hydrolase